MHYALFFLGTSKYIALNFIDNKSGFGFFFCFHGGNPPIYPSILKEDEEVSIYYPSFQPSMYPLPSSLCACMW